MKIGIIGAGHAGTAAAFEAARLGAEVTLFSNEDALPYYRPRIPSVAFGQITPEEAVMSGMEKYSDAGINLLLNTGVATVFPDRTLQTLSGEKHSFDRIIISTGANPLVPPFAEKVRRSEKFSCLWNIREALAIRKNLDSIRKLVIIGGGVIGIETALRASDVGISVIIIEKAPRLMARNLTEKASTALEKSLSGKGIQILKDSSVLELVDCPGRIKVITDKGPFDGDFVIMSIGARPNLDPVTGLGAVIDKGLITDNKMTTSLNYIYSAGDICRTPDSLFICSAVKASAQGKIAGANAAEPQGGHLFVPSPVTVQVKYKDFALFSAGSPMFPDSVEEIIENQPGCYRSLVRKDGTIFGVHMIGSDKDFNTYRKLIKEK